VRLVVFNADDFGLSAAANAAIAAAADAGLVREASLMPAGAAAAEAVAMLRDRDLGVGLHLSFTEGRALTGRLRGLTDARGAFRPLPVVLASCVARAPRPAEVRREIEAQLAWLRERGLAVDHVNGHHHAHAFPVIRDILLEILRDAGGGPLHLRVPAEGGASGGLLSPRRPVVRRLAAGLRRRARGSGLTTLPLVGLFAPPARALRWCTAPAVECAIHAPVDPAPVLRLAVQPARYGEVLGFASTL